MAPFFGKKKKSSGKKNPGNQDSEIHDLTIEPTQPPVIQPSSQPPVIQVSSQTPPIQPSPQTPGDDFFQNLLGMGTPSPYQQPSPLQHPTPYQFAGYPGTPGGLPYVVGSQYAQFPPQHFQPYPNMAPTPQPLPVPVPIPTPDEVYRPDIVQNLFSTPSSTPRSDRGSTYVPDTDQESSGPGRGLSRKGKEPVGDTSGSEKQKRPRSTYTDGESKMIAQCWTEVSTDPSVGNYQTELKFWERVHDAYMAHKEPYMKEHTPEQMRRHWERLMKECGVFNGIYRNLVDNAPSGATEYSLRAEASARYASQCNITHGFKWWDIYDMLKDLPKFRRGMHKALQEKSRRTRLCDDDGSPSSGADPMEPPPSRRRPMGNRTAKDLKKAKGKGKGKAPKEHPSDAVNAAHSKSLSQLYTVYFYTPMSDEHRASLWHTINGIKKMMGLIEESEPEPPRLNSNNPTSIDDDDDETTSE